MNLTSISAAVAKDINFSNGTKGLLAALRKGNPGQAFSTTYTHLSNHSKPGVVYILERATKATHGKAVFIEELLPGGPPVRLLISEIFRNGSPTLSYTLLAK